MKKLIDEADIISKEGKVLISPGLKVRHKESQFEYTVDSAERDSKGKITVYLKLPSSARFKPPEDEDYDDVKSASGVDYNVKTRSSLYLSDDDDDNSDVLDDDELLAVPEAEFEKEYEI